MRPIIFLVLKTVVLRIPDDVTVKAIISGRQNELLQERVALSSVTVISAFQ